MPINKQAFYEGAALHLLARGEDIRGLRYVAPFFLLNDTLLVYLKHSTKVRSPWGFSFTREELDLLSNRAAASPLVVGLVCGSDGVAAMTHRDLDVIAGDQSSTVHIACYRKHGEHYEVRGPVGIVDRKIPPLDWQRILED